MNEIAKRRMMPKIYRSEMCLKNNCSGDLIYKTALDMLIEMQKLISEGVVNEHDDKVTKIKESINAIMDIASPEICF